MENAEAMSLGQQHQQAGNLVQAEKIYRQVLHVDPDNANAKYRLAVVCQLQGHAADAITLYQQLLIIKPDSAKVHNNLGLVYASQNHFAEAQACYQQAVRLQPDFAEAFNNLGNLLTARGEWDRARNAYIQALALKPAYPAAWSNLGRIHFQQERWDEAARCFRQALTLQPKNAIVLNQLGNALFEQRQYDEAGEQYREAVRVQPDHAEAHYNLARVLRLQFRPEDAAFCLQQSLYHNPDSALAHAALADIYYCNLNRFTDALAHYRLVLALKPDDRKAQLLVEALTGGSQLDRVPREYLTAVYEPLADRFDQMVGQRGDRSPQWLKAALVAPPPASLDVLDLGCGTGLCGLQFRDWARTLVGVDLSANMLAKSRDRGVYDELILSDLLPALESYEARFDLIVASDVLLYVGDLAPVFKAARQALRPGGRFAFTVDVLRDGHDYRLTPWIHFAHSRNYIQRLASETAMQEICVQEVTFPRDAGQQAGGLVVVFGR